MPSVRSHGTSIYYEEQGAGPALVFAHGAGGNALSWWQQVPFFARDHRVICFDHRGFGRSACEPEAFQPSWFADDLRAILDALELPQAAVVCQSMGGWTGLRLALEQPQRVRCLVLGGTPAGVFSPRVLEAAAGVGQRLASEGVSGAAALAPDFPVREPALAFLYDQIGRYRELKFGMFDATDSRVSQEG